MVCIPTMNRIFQITLFRLLLQYFIFGYKPTQAPRTTDLGFDDAILTCNVDKCFSNNRQNCGTNPINDQSYFYNPDTSKCDNTYCYQEDVPLQDCKDFCKDCKKLAKFYKPTTGLDDCVKQIMYVGGVSQKGHKLVKSTPWAFFTGEGKCNKFNFGIFGPPYFKQGTMVTLPILYFINKAECDKRCPPVY